MIITIFNILHLYLLGQCQFKLYHLGLDAAPAVTGIQQEAIEEEDDGEDNSSWIVK